MTPFSRLNRVTSAFGYREYINSAGKLIKEYHNGQDIVPTKYVGEVVPESAWNVREVTGGTVTEVSTGYNAGRGSLVKVKTASGDIEIYQHLKSYNVAKGQEVAQGEIIGVAGNTGNVTGRHLHFEVQRNGVAINPEEWSDVPNAVGTFEANDNKDGSTVTESKFKPFDSQECKVLVTGPNGAALSSGDINYYLKQWADSTRVNLQVLDTQYVVLGPMSSGDQISIQQYNADNNLGWVLTKYQETSKVYVVATGVFTDASTLDAHCESLKSKGFVPQIINLNM